MMLADTDRRTDWIYYKKVQAHRHFMYAISLYKYLTYDQQSQSTQQQQIYRGSETKSSLPNDHDQKLDEIKNMTWFEVDQQFIRVIELYNQKELRNTDSLKLLSKRFDDDSDGELEVGMTNQPIFIDLMVKVMLYRVHVNIRDRKLLTAERILGNAEALIKHLEKGVDLRIVNYLPIR